MKITQKLVGGPHDGQVEDVTMRGKIASGILVGLTRELSSTPGVKLPSYRYARRIDGEDELIVEFDYEGEKTVNEFFKGQ